MLALVRSTTGGTASLVWENDTYFQKRYPPIIAMVTFATATIAGQRLFVLPENEKIQPAAGDGRSSTKVVLPENDNPAGRHRRPFQY